MLEDEEYMNGNIVPSEFRDDWETYCMGFSSGGKAHDLAHRSVFVSAMTIPTHRDPSDASDADTDALPDYVGNVTRFINDYRVDPYRLEKHSMMDPVEEKRTRLNCQPCLVTWHGWPYMIIVSVKEIGRGEELLLDYGAIYWNIKRRAIFPNGLGRPGQLHPSGRLAFKTPSYVVTE